MIQQFYFWVYSQRNEISKETPAHPCFTAARSTTTNIRNQPRCPTTDEWINEMWSIYTMDY
jgi:hypothetical protein